MIEQRIEQPEPGNDPFLRVQGQVNKVLEARKTNLPSLKEDTLIELGEVIAQTDGAVEAVRTLNEMEANKPQRLLGTNQPKAEWKPEVDTVTDHYGNVYRIPNI